MVWPRARRRNRETEPGEERNLILQPPEKTLVRVVKEIEHERDTEAIDAFQLVARLKQTFYFWRRTHDPVRRRSNGETFESQYDQLFGSYEGGAAHYPQGIPVDVKRDMIRLSYVVSEFPMRDPSDHELVNTTTAGGAGAFIALLAQTLFTDFPVNRRKLLGILGLTVAGGALGTLAGLVPSSGYNTILTRFKQNAQYLDGMYETAYGPQGPHHIEVH